MFHQCHLNIVRYVASPEKNQSYKDYHNFSYADHTQRQRARKTFNARHLAVSTGEKVLGPPLLDEAAWISQDQVREQEAAAANQRAGA